MKRVLLALLGGAVVGAVIGFLLWPGSEGEGPAERLRRFGDVARRALDEGQRRVRRAPGSATTGGPPTPEPSAGGRPPAVPARLRETFRRWREALRARWREAVAEGRRASAETQQELRRRYERLTGRA